MTSTSSLSIRLGRAGGPTIHPGPTGKGGPLNCNVDRMLHTLQIPNNILIIQRLKEIFVVVFVVRFIIHSDDSNPTLSTVESFGERLSKFRPHLLVVGGLQMMDNFPFPPGQLPVERGWLFMD